jgi:alkylation response protein AidB-like acyl-CoA dehydrogenase
MNFYRADPALTDLLRLHLPDALFRHIEPHLDRLGELAGGYLDECARLADRHTPVLHQRDKFGRDTQYIEYHPAYRELEKAAFGEFGIHALSIRKGIMGWPDKYPVVAKHAFTFLFNQTEFGMGCPINVTDGCAKLLNNFGSEALKAKYLDGLTQTDMSKLTQGGQFMTEKEGGSDVGTLTTTAVQEGDHWRLYGEKWFCSNADAKVVMLLARPEGAGPGTRGVGLFLMPRLSRRRLAEPLPDRSPEGQARHPLDGLGRDQARRRDRLCRRQARPRLLCRWPRWSIRRGSPTASSRPR